MKNSKVLNFPKSKQTKPEWLLKMKNLRKGYYISIVLSLVSVVASLALILFIVLKLNNAF
jgi:hypothetical protein